MRLRWLVLQVALVALMPSVTVFAQEAETESPDEGPSREDMARAHFEIGRTAFAEGRFEDALASFQRAYDLSGRPVLLFNIGASLDRLRRNEEALDTFEHYLRVLPDADNRAEVEGRITSLRAAIRREHDREEELRAHEEERLRLEAELASERDDGIFGKWWFWTIVGGVLVAGGAVALGFALYDPGVEGPLLGTTQAVGTTLTWGGP